MAYCTLAEVKQYLHGTTWAADADRDDFITDLCDRASAVIDLWLVQQARSVGAEAVTEKDRVWVAGDGCLTLFPRRRPVNSVTSLTYKRAPSDTAETVDAADIDTTNDVVRAYLGLAPTIDSRPYLVTLIYNGGLDIAGSPTTAAAEALKHAAVRTVAFWLYQRNNQRFEVVVDLTSGTKHVPAALPRDAEQILERLVAA